jgi:transcriptional regulator
MHVPPPFAETDQEKLAALMSRYSFATIVTSDGNTPFASHIPVLFYPECGTRGAIAGHVARANPQWRQFDSSREVLIVFQGPHGYVSPAWYVNQPAVPTWNYAVVHAYGTPKIMESEAEVEALLQATIDKYEAGRQLPWRGSLPPDFKSKMMKGIVAFEIAVTRLEGKFKLSQNRSPEDVAGVIDMLARSVDPMDRALAGMMAG